MTLGRRTAVSRLRTIGRSAAMLVGIGALAGCQALHDFVAEPCANPPVRDDPVVERAKPDRAETAKDTEIVTLDRTAVKRLQARLAGLGFAPGPVDGIIGPRTTGAIRRYQVAHSLPATGRTSTRFLRHVEAKASGARTESPPPARLGREDLPAYRPGTTFVYSNGDTAQVRATKGPLIQWTRHDRTAYTADRNFLLPWLHWRSERERGTAEISQPGERLWPLREAAEVTFTAKLMIQRRDDPDLAERRVERWRCRNDGRRDVTVGAGTFETLVLVCKGGAGTSETVRTWYYAKAIRHYVRFVESEAGQGDPATVDLVAIRPGAPDWPPIVRAALTRALVHALESPEPRSRVPWTSSGVNTRVTIETTPQFVADDGRTCRRFVQVWSEDGRRRHYPGMACQVAPGRWRIPGLTGSTEKALAVSDGLS